VALKLEVEDGRDMSGLTRSELRIPRTQELFLNAACELSKLDTQEEK
jgi:hypothetical protein